MKITGEPLNITLHFRLIALINRCTDFTSITPHIINLIDHIFLSVAHLLLPAQYLPLRYASP